MISDDMLNKFIENPSDYGPTVTAMAKEILAYRQAFSEPAIWANKTDVDTVADHILARKNQSLACTLPLYRKPTIPE
ncbi:hypothetical protein MXM51_01525 [Pantoea stewartii]|uniref:hypothetical protein n=1 Tax=Pantoea stewartii TaxID=66269 RepID=UPI002DC057FA|nr:hypothetical protein [Pantoea stewartii]MEB6533230.1 hypothetical protein [Pantoea stewartii]